MVSQRAHRGCAFVQELQCRNNQPDVPDAWSGIIQLDGAHAATPADSYGISSTKGRDGALRWRPCGAGRATDGRQTNDTIPSTSHHRLWLDRSGRKHVYFEQTG